MRPFSLQAREDDRRAARETLFDAVVVGAGINGAGIARDLALRGLTVAVVDRGDAGGGTSSRSSRLIHGGLRYLQHGHLGLVAESTAHRWRLLHLASHLVTPLPFLFPSYRGDHTPRWMVRVGVALYGLLSLGRTPGPSRGLSPAGVLAAEPGLAREGLTGGVEYHDCATDDGRLTLETLRDAHAAGAIFFPRTEVTGGIREGGRLRGVAVRDLLDGAAWELRGRVVINASGPWTDAVHARLVPGGVPRWLRPTKGVHLVFPRERLPVSRAVTMIVPEDRRPVFAIPWGTAVYVGTTDTDVADPDAPLETTPADTDYLLRVTGRFFPGAGLGAGDVLSSWAGLRPLVWDEAAASASDVSREERIAEAAPGLVTVAGGKLTTFLLMARRTADLAARVLARDHGVNVPRSRAERLALLAVRPAGGLAAARTLAAARAAERGLPVDGAALAARRGFDALALLDLMAAEPALAEPCAPGLPWRAAELRFAVDHEYALTAEDLLVRRTHLFYRDPAHGAGVDLTGLSLTPPFQPVEL
ncbi:MAG: glycerol-3-phosphate dehydrogenase/oxidase [Deltaproteobacteria bacterium]|nr:glycerol-3-phosphate dehydrogenase/oxidase [Deltaproteobacteria bacterium]